MAGTTALLNSAASTRAALADYQDKIMSFQYSNSAYTDSAFSAYQDYLQSRIGSLSSSGSVSNASKALSLTETLRSATKQNMSSSIQRENIQIMAGNATLTDKYNLVANQFVKAQAIGDNTLAQSLMSQAYSISQSIQVQQQEASNAYATQSKAAATAGARSYSDLAQTLKNKLDAFNQDYANAGRTSANKVTADFVKTMEPTFKALGITLKDGQQPNYFDIVAGTNQAIVSSYHNAYTIAAPYATDGGQSFIDKGLSAAQNIKTNYGTMNPQQLASAAANPNQFSYTEDPQFVKKAESGVGGKQNQQIGYTIDQKANITPTIASSPWIKIPDNINNQIQALNLNIVSGKNNGIEVAYSAQSPEWLKQIMGSDNATTHIVSNDQGQLQFEADAAHGQGKAVYTIAKDNTVWESSNLGDRMLYNPNPQPQQVSNDPGGSSFGFGNFKNNMSNLFGGLSHGASDVFSGAGNFLNGLNGHASAMGLSGILSNATSNYSLPPLPMAQAPQQTVSLAQLPPAPSISVAPPHAQPVNAPTYNPQTPSTQPIQGGGSPQQTGGGFNLNQGGGGWSMRL